MRRQKARDGCPDNGVGGQYHSKAPQLAASIWLARKTEQFVTAFRGGAAVHRAPRTNGTNAAHPW
jgi:hypothetical protein